MPRLISLTGVLLFYWRTGMHRQRPVSIPISWLLKGSQTRTMVMQDADPQSKNSQHPDHNMQWRTDHLAQACASLRQNHTNNPNSISYVHLFEDMPIKLVYSDRFKLIGCKLPKVGSTNIRRLLYTLDHLSYTNDVNEIGMKASSWNIVPKKLHSSQISELKRKLDTYTKFLIIRDPIERHVSAYRDENKYKYKSKTTPFNEWLVKAILNKTKAKFNRHVMPFNQWCKPCSMTYDFVGQLNNFDEDMDTILEHVGARDLVILPTREQTNYTEVKSFDVADKYRRTIPKYMLKQIYETYYLDYFLFGFPRPY